MVQGWGRTEHQTEEKIQREMETRGLWVDIGLRVQGYGRMEKKMAKKVDKHMEARVCRGAYSIVIVTDIVVLDSLYAHSIGYLKYTSG